MHSRSAQLLALLVVVVCIVTAVGIQPLAEMVGITAMLVAVSEFRPARYKQTQLKPTRLVLPLAIAVVIITACNDREYVALLVALVALFIHLDKVSWAELFTFHVLLYANLCLVFGNVPGRLVFMLSAAWMAIGTQCKPERIPDDVWRATIGIPLLLWICGYMRPESLLSTYEVYLFLATACAAAYCCWEIFVWCLLVQFLPNLAAQDSSVDAKKPPVPVRLVQWCEEMLTESAAERARNSASAAQERERTPENEDGMNQRKEDGGTHLQRADEEDGIPDVPPVKEPAKPSTLEILLPWWRKLNIFATQLQTAEVVAQAQHYDALAQREMSRSRAVHAPQEAEVGHAERVLAKGNTLTRAEQLAQEQHETAMESERIKRVRLKADAERVAGGATSQSRSKEERVEREYAERIAEERAKAQGERNLTKARAEIHTDNVKGIFRRYYGAYEVTASAVDKVIACADSTQILDIIPDAPEALIRELENTIDKHYQARD